MIYLKFKYSGLFSLFICAVLIFSSNHVTAQDCACDEYIYLNEVQNGGAVHKYKVNADGSLTEINPNGPWYPNGGVSEMSLPHGLGSDLNGYLYIGESLDSDSEIRRLDCDGSIMPTSVYSIPNTPTFNVVSTGNTAFSTTVGSQTVEAWDLCDGTSLGGVCLASNSGSTVSHGWGLYEYPEGTFYTYSASNGGSVYKFTEADLNGPCVSPLFEGPAEIGISATVYGLTVDSQGNVYIVENNFGGSGAGKILKFDASGNYICETPLDQTDGDGGYYGIYGVVYSPTCDCLYSSNFTTDDDCVSRFDLNCNYVGAVVDPVGGVANNTAAVFGKAIARQQECCPLFDSREHNQYVCDPVEGETYFMIDFLPCEFICAGQWEVVSNTAGTFNPCNNSFTYEQIGEGCFTYSYDPGANANAICQAFTIDVCVAFGETPPPPVVSQTCDEDSGVGEFTVATPCVDGSFIEYSTDNGSTWSVNMPTWAQGTSVTARCFTEGKFSCIGESTDPPIVGSCDLTTVFDLALTNMYDSFQDLDGSGTITPGDEVKFNIVVYNQGTQPATDIIVENYIPTGMTFASSMDFVAVGGGYQATIPTLAPGASATLMIILTVDSGSTGVLTNNAEIISADNDGDPSTPAPVDEDSPIGPTGSSDDTSEVGSDDDIADDSTGGTDNPADIDSYDPAQIEVGTACPDPNCFNITVRSE